MDVKGISPANHLVKATFRDPLIAMASHALEIARTCESIRKPGCSVTIGFVCATVSKCQDARMIIEVDIFQWPATVSIPSSTQSTAPRQDVIDIATSVVDTYLQSLNAQMDFRSWAHTRGQDGALGWDVEDMWHAVPITSKEREA
jgi:hypothetical protein